MGLKREHTLYIDLKRLNDMEQVAATPPQCENAGRIAARSWRDATNRNGQREPGSNGVGPVPGCHPPQQLLPSTAHPTSSSSSSSSSSFFYPLHNLTLHLSMIEESSPSDPPPPDIRPCRRITQPNNNNNNHNNTANESRRDALHGAVSAPQPLPNRDETRTRHYDNNPRRRFARFASLTRHAGFHTVLLVALVALVFATPSAASPIGPHASNTTTAVIADADVWTSGPDITYQPRHTWDKAPVISFLRWAFRRVTAVAAGWAGYDLVPSSLVSGMSDLGLAKRSNLSTGEIVEACMIPILVVLSGIFAGLTLG
jgi:hypothetical protein